MIRMDFTGVDVSSGSEQIPAVELFCEHAVADRALRLRFLQIVWDVGHQAYGHKILTGRRSRMPTIRQTGGLSGRTCRLCIAESHPVLQTGLSRHASVIMHHCIIVIKRCPVIMQPAPAQACLICECRLHKEG